MSGFEDVSVVLITRNEEKAITKVITDILAAAPSAEVIVVDGSDDATPELASAAGATVMREPAEGGFGPALLMALTSATRPIVVTLDADDTYPVTMIGPLADLVRSGFDVAGGSRISRGRPPAMPAPNYLANLLFARLGGLAVGQRAEDPHSGMRAYRREVIHGIRWSTRGLAFPVDLLLLPIAEGWKVVEVPIRYRERIGETTLERLPSTGWTLRRIGRAFSRRLRGSSGRRS